LEIKDFAKEIAGRSSLTRGDIENVLTNFIDELPTFLKLGFGFAIAIDASAREQAVRDRFETQTECQNKICTG
jgi:hypothetical protein